LSFATNIRRPESTAVKKPLSFATNIRRPQEAETIRRLDSGTVRRLSDANPDSLTVRLNLAEKNRKDREKSSMRPSKSYDAPVPRRSI
jgi:hypothetical protein